MELSDIVTATISLIAVILSVLSLWLQRRDKSYRLRIILEVPADGRAYTVITVTNVGRVSIPIDSLGTLDPKGKEFYPQRPGGLKTYPALYEGPPWTYLEPKPSELLHGKKLSMRTETRFLAHGLKNRGYSGKVKIRAFCENGVTKPFRSSPVLVDIDKLIS